MFMTRLLLNHGLSTLIKMIICINELAEVNSHTNGARMIYILKVIRRVVLMSILQLMALERK